MVQQVVFYGLEVEIGLIMSLRLILEWYMHLTLIHIDVN